MICLKLLYERIINDISFADKGLAITNVQMWWVEVLTRQISIEEFLDTCVVIVQKLSFGISRRQNQPHINGTRLRNFLSQTVHLLYAQHVTDGNDMLEDTKTHI